MPGLALMLLALVLLTRGAVGSDWSRSGNDMEFLLPALEHDSPTEYLFGPWAGRDIFHYYRPVTSVVMWLELRIFGKEPTGWQVFSLFLHLASVTLLTLLLRLIVRSSVAALIGAGLWAFRDRIFETIAWVPAQTDLLAGCFSLMCLLAIANYAKKGHGHWATVAGTSGLLAAGSKEIALVLAGLCPVVTWMVQPSGSRRAIRCAASATILLIGFLSLRFSALGGLGFLPGQAVGGGTDSTITPTSVARRFFHFLLPYPLGPIGSVNLIATWSVSLSAAATWILRARPGMALAASLIGLLFAGIALGDVSWFLLPETWAHFAWATLTFVCLAVPASKSPQMISKVLLFGVCAVTPLYHVVYNVAGNVTYLPDVYHALLWAWACAWWLRSAAHLAATRQWSGTA